MASSYVKPGIEEKLQKAVEFKESGNAYYKEKDFDSDLHGTPAFLQSASVDPNHAKHIDKDLESRCIQTNISVYNNLCACLLADPDKADSSAERIKELAEI